MSENRIDDSPSQPFRYHIALAGLVEIAAREGVLLEDRARQAEYDATHDGLTGALNRDGLKKYLESTEAPVAALVVDGTNVKAFNDKYGYKVGDAVIVSIFEVLQKCVRPKDEIARWGGDEFVVILNKEDEENNIEAEFNRRSIHVRKEHIEPIKVRIATEMDFFLDAHPEYRAENFDLAVGGIEWPGDVPIADLIEEAKKEMQLHKDDQHKAGRHRAA